MSEELFALAPSSEPETITRKKSSPISMSTFLDRCKAIDEAAIRDYRPVFAYAESIKLPMDMLQLAWFEFVRIYSRGGTHDNKRQIDWRRTFRNYVEKNYLKLWYLDDNGQWQLTTVGRQAKLANANRLAG